MKVIVVRVAPKWKLIQRGVNQGLGDYLRVTFKKYDGSKGAIYLNLPEEKLFQGSRYWEKKCKPGNVLNVQLQPDGKSVDYRQPFEIIDIKDVNKEN